jgi:hypothetical protein
MGRQAWLGRKVSRAWFLFFFFKLIFKTTFLFKFKSKLSGTTLGVPLNNGEILT